ncbi:hypothetical protein KK083_15290 [Fulvivirgaceae bacterium PWU4]|uniref:Uncharacterized protein n=1 Tax=Chryseosolibacter histidini TaxID=2782349 RepID=A0AAP2GJE3_9BACT|nr:hypothetical protein [Chryseosolibacter histidini]MBT1698256.1 hypothetical protein [Chryseosolibacter histidini]
MKSLPPQLEARIDEVKSWLFDGDQDKVASKSRKSRAWVNKVLNKKAFNAQILVAAIEVMNENKARFGCM